MFIKIKIKLFLFVLQIGMILLPLYSYQFPVKNLRITSVFGESRGDHFHTGIDFGTKQNIYPIEKGEMIFIRDKGS